MKYFALIMLLFVNKVGAVNCNALLQANQRDEIHLAPADAVAISQKFHDEFELGTEPIRLLDRFGLDPGRHSQIVLFNLTRFFGDNLIFYFSLMDYFRRAYPNVPLKVISPKANIFERAQNLDFEWVQFPVTFAQHRGRTDRVEAIRRMKRRFLEFITQNVPRDAFVLYDLTTLDKADEELAQLAPDEVPPSNEFRRMLTKVGATGIGIGNLHKERIFLGLTALDVVAPVSSLPAHLVTSSHYKTFKTQWEDAHALQFRGQIRFSEETIYGNWLENLSLVFGKEFYLAWRSRDFVNPQEDPSLLKTMLLEAGLDPNQRYALLNLNTYGGDKVRDLRAVFAEIVRATAEHVLKTNPGLNLLVWFPETQFGPEVQREVLDFAHEHRGRIGLVSSSKWEIMPAIVAAAKWVVSYDSGMFHLAAFLPKERVLSVGLFSASGDKWRKPNQEFVKIAEDESVDLLIDQTNRWIDRVEESLR